LLFEWNHIEQNECPVLAVAHSTSLRKASKIVVSGFAALSTLDDGFYGVGMYFSSSALYTLPYCFHHPDPCILLCFLVPGNPYPVIEHPLQPEGLKGKHILTGYQSHYVVTQRNGLPLEENNFERKFNEIVIDQESQVVPIFLIELLTTNFSTLHEYFKREIADEKVDVDESYPDDYIGRVFPVFENSKQEEITVCQVDKENKVNASSASGMRRIISISSGPRPDN